MSPKAIGTQRRTQVKRAFHNYRDRGWVVFPVNEKQPKIKGWRNKLVSKEGEFDEWIERFEDFGLALICGEPSGVVVIDVDGEEAIDYFRTSCGGEFPNTPTVKTPSGGRHFYFACPPGGFKGTDKIFEGQHCEVRIIGTGRYAVVPPSVLRDGGKYRWMKGKSIDDLELAELPDWILSTSRSVKKEDDNIDTKSIESEFSEFAKRCARFSEALRDAENSSLDVDTGIRFARVFGAYGRSDMASVWLEKIKGVSSKQLSIFESDMEKGTLKFPRCEGFGCTSTQLGACHRNLNPSPRGGYTNSPKRVLDKALTKTDLTLVTPKRGSLTPLHVEISESLNGSPYFIGDDGELYLEGEKSATRLANFFAYPIEERRVTSGSGSRLVYIYEGITSSGKKLPPVELKAEEVNRMTAFTCAWGLDASFAPTFNAKAYSADAFRRFRKRLQRHDAYRGFGWQEFSGEWDFLFSGGSLNGNREVDTRPGFERFSLPPSVDEPQTVLKTTLEILKLAPLQVTIPLLGLVFLSPLVSLLEKVKIAPKFVVWLVGNSGARKTTIATLLMNFFGDFKGGSPVASFEDTETVVERIAAELKDQLLVLDDFRVRSSGYKTQGQKSLAEVAIRSHAERKGKGRSNIELGIRFGDSPSGMLLITGEDLPDGHSTLARVLCLELKEKEVDLDVLTRLQGNTDDLNAAMRIYLEYVRDNIDDLIGSFVVKFTENRAYFTHGDYHGRLPEAASWLLLAFGLYLKVLRKNRVIDKLEMSRLLKQAKDAILSMLGDQVRLVREHRPAYVFVSAIKEMLEAGEVRFVDLNSSATRYHRSEAIGWEDEQYYYVLPGPTLSRINKRLQQNRVPMELRKEQLATELEGLGWIKISEGTRKYKLPKKTIPKDKQLDGVGADGRARVFYLEKNAVHNSEL